MEASVAVGHEVDITIDGKRFKVKPGRMTVAALKALASIPACDDVDEVINGKLVPLDDNGSVTIKENEKFVSHPKNCGSSWE